MSRPTKKEYYLLIARDVATRSTCLRRRYGAVIVNKGRIVSTGYNGSPRGEINCCDRGVCPRMDKNIPHNTGDYSDCCSVHAEQNAIIHASFEDMQGATLYLSGLNPDDTIIAGIAPCPICSRMISNAGIKEIICDSPKKEREKLPLFVESKYKKAFIDYLLMNKESMKEHPISLYTKIDSSGLIDSKYKIGDVIGIDIKDVSTVTFEAFDTPEFRDFISLRGSGAGVYTAPVFIFDDSAKKITALLGFIASTAPTAGEYVPVLEKEKLDELVEFMNKADSKEGSE